MHFEHRFVTMFRWTIHVGGSERWRHAAVTVGQKVYSFGGVSDQIGVHIFNSESLLWTTLTPETPGREGRHLEIPSRRRYHTAVLTEDEKDGLNQRFLGAFQRRVVKTLPVC